MGLGSEGKQFRKFLKLSVAKVVAEEWTWTLYAVGTHPLM